FFLNAFDDWSGGEQRAWLDKELTSADDEPGLAWRFAIVHHGAWSAGPHGSSPKLAAAGVPAVLATHKIDLLISGHDHIYERGHALLECARALALRVRRGRRASGPGATHHGPRALPLPRAPQEALVSTHAIHRRAVCVRRHVWPRLPRLRDVPRRSRAQPARV